MARKRDEAMAQAEVIDTTHAVRLDLPSRPHKLLRLVAAYEGVSMANYARDLVSRHLEDEAKRKGIKL
jgi:hypothetical protein